MSRPVWLGESFSVSPSSPGDLSELSFFDFILKLLWFNVLVKERVNREDRVLHFVQCLFFSSCYPMSSCLIVGGLCMLQEMMSKGIPEPVPSLRPGRQ